MSKKYNRDADPTDWLTGSLAQKEPRRQSKLEQYNNNNAEAEFEY